MLYDRWAGGPKWRLEMRWGLWEREKWTKKAYELQAAVWELASYREARTQRNTSASNLRDGVREQSGLTGRTEASNLASAVEHITAWEHHHRHVLVPGISGSNPQSAISHQPHRNWPKQQGRSPRAAQSPSKPSRSTGEQRPFAGLLICCTSSPSRQPGQLLGRLGRIGWEGAYIRVTQCALCDMSILAMTLAAVRGGLLASGARRNMTV